MKNIKHQRIIHILTSFINKKKLILFVSLILLSASPDSINSIFISAAEFIKPSVVNITVYKKNIKNGKTILKETAIASGTIISSDGYIVTNNHVVRKGDYYKLTGADGKKYEVEPFNPEMNYLSDPKTDIALLKVDVSSGIKLKPASFEDSNILNEGEWVIAVGNPFGLNMSVTAGIVSSKGRDNIGFTDIEDFIQTDVSINPGNSGGPLINLNGKLVGINTAIKSHSGGYQGISFAIPSNIVKRISRDLIKYKRVKRGWLGFFARENPTNREKDEFSIEIISIIKHSPAESAGLKTGDIIKEINGKKIKTLSSLIKEIGNKETGTEISIISVRQGRIKEFKLILREKREFKKLKNLNEKLYSRYGFEIDENFTNEIVVVYTSHISSGRGLKIGDTITSINDKPIADIAIFLKVFDKLNGDISNITLSRDGEIYKINFNGKSFE